ncbi:hypothetical protein COCSUDRAFT_58138 [Coccomyxa subellipsoidea C-169]|uniref:Uncharacterized protein n=1 Tax=Coccomyxa subellipsoidea (strain C-169) TaxID=574566 RepID=I0YND4_COCSC|nr:hypothetical protein COCSUDRAFT_58138 [Coccomyxa subellipsoidea C-169]EIE19903.1 hypothetical protein COCSUDRAFT_58138 [Coccomyxa subellipsoidea C-169]|eukprot:XP_005644447.1 hypothetical protein COCSUDRAFT_58138 [Coccomyxa subellipsoidea C-169]
MDAMYRIGDPFKGRTAAPHRIKQWALAHAAHRPEYKALLLQQGEEYLDALPKNERTKQPGYKQYTKRMRSLRFYTSVHMLETAGYCLPKEQQRLWDERRGIAKEFEEVEDSEGSVEEVEEVLPDASVPKVQVNPDGWEAFYGRLKCSNNHGYLVYKTVCSCGKVKISDGGPHTVKKWWEEHGGHRPEYADLEPRPEERYPNTLTLGERIGHQGYKDYRERLQRLGFYTSVQMLETAGFCLPPEAQKMWDDLRKGEAKAPRQRKSADGPRQKRKRGRQASSEDSSQQEQSALVEAAEGGVEAGSAAVKPEPREATPSPDTPAQVDKSKQRAPTPQIPTDSEEAGPSAPPDLDARARPSGPPRAAARFTRAPGQAMRRDDIEVVDLSDDSPKASSSTQRPAELAAGLQTAVPGQGRAGHALAEGHVPVSSRAARQEPPAGAANAALPPPLGHFVLSVPSSERIGAFTLEDVIADITRLKELKPQIAAAGIGLDFDKILQCLHAARVREARNERLLTLKDEENKSLRSQLEVVQS